MNTDPQSPAAGSPRSHPSETYQSMPPLPVPDPGISQPSHPYQSQVAHHAGQPAVPGWPPTSNVGQAHPRHPYPAPLHPGQPYPAQSYPGQPYPGQPYHPGLGQLPPMPAPTQPPADAPGGPGEYAYHRLAHTSTEYRWWRPLPTLAISLAIWLGLSTSVLILALVLRPEILEIFGGKSIQADPVIFLVLFGSVAVLAPAVLIAQLVAGWKPVGLLSSVAGRIRWRWFAYCMMAAGVIFGALFAVTYVFSADAFPTYNYDAVWISAAVALFAVVPIQCAAEEYLFRGFGMQSIGHWLKHPAWAILIPVPLFVVGHAYSGWAMLDTALFAALAGFLVWRTGGLEAAIALHIANNLMGVSAGLWQSGSFSPTDSGSWESTLMSTAIYLVFFGIVEVGFRRFKLERTLVIPDQGSAAIGPSPVVVA